MTGQYFDAQPATPSERRRVPLVLPDLTTELLTDRAVFSGERIDPGSKYLLLEVPTPAASAAHGLDLGCGYGPIAVTMATRAPQLAVWAVDVNERAVDLCRDNATALGLTNLHASVSRDDQPFGAVPPDVRFDVIWSNPPIRIGKPALHALLTTWLGRLADDGHAYLVVQKHLGSDSLQTWLIAQGWPTHRVSSRAGYRLFDVTRPSGSG